jgi:hypothetical protein
MILKAVIGFRIVPIQKPRSRRASSENRGKKNPEYRIYLIYPLKIKEYFVGWL